MFDLYVCPKCNTKHPFIYECMVCSGTMVLVKNQALRDALINLIGITDKTDLQYCTSFTHDQLIAAVEEI